MQFKALALSFMLLAACRENSGLELTPDIAEVSALSGTITTQPWQEVVIGVPDFGDVMRFFTQIGNYAVLEQSDATLLLAAPGSDNGYIRFQLTESNAEQTRPFGSRSWDTGCYWSVMLRAKNLVTIIEDAKALGWLPHTEMTYFEFGPSKLNIIVLTHEKTGVQVQLYERLTTPLPEGFPEFERISRPFNVMQMAANRDVAFAFFKNSLGFDTFYLGEPSVSKTAEPMPLGIPVDQVMSIPFLAGIVTPKSGLEWGRMEMIEVQMPGGKDLSKRCEPGNTGIHTVRFDVDDLDKASQILRARKLSPKVTPNGIVIKSPDGANIEFIQK